MRRLGWLIGGTLLLLAVVLAWWPGIAGAQTASEQPRPFTLPVCRPTFLGGPGIGFKVIEGPNGACGGYWCLDPTWPGGWRPWQFCAIPGYAWLSLTEATIALAAKGPMTDESFAAFIQKNQQAPTSAGVSFYNALHAKMDAAMLTTKPAPPAPPPPPPPPAWVVDAATAADGTRPAYPYVNGVRGSTSTARAIAGQPCRPDVSQSTSNVAGKVFAAYGPNYSPALHALCRKP